jgi:hypothetical protein
MSIYVDSNIQRNMYTLTLRGALFVNLRVYIEFNNVTT